MESKLARDLQNAVHSHVLAFLGLSGGASSRNSEVLEIPGVPDIQEDKQSRKFRKIHRFRSLRGTRKFIKNPLILELPEDREFRNSQKFPKFRSFRSCWRHDTRNTKSLGILFEVAWKLPVAPVLYGLSGWISPGVQATSCIT